MPELCEQIRACLAGDSPEVLAPALLALAVAEIERLRASQVVLGPTGRYPEGQLTEHDEGELTVGLTDQGGVVILHFGKPVAWIGLPPEQAKQLAQALIERADKVGRLGGWDG